MAGHGRITLSFYKYHRIEDPAGFRDRLFEAWDALGVLGRIYVASEGINAQLSLPANRLEGFRAYLDGIPFLQGVRLNIAVEQDDRSFLKLKIKLRARIVADGIEDPDFDVTKAGRHLDARAFNDFIGDPDAIVVDMRNHFESEIGYFRNAVRPDVDTFRDSLGAIENDLKAHKESKKLVMYCTGGIRCEKASAYFLHKGFREVYQLEGGIIEYLRQVKAEGLRNEFVGKNFVFDARMAERISADVVSACHQCGTPSDSHANCGNPACHVLFIQCPSCSRRMRGCCSDRCSAIAILPESTQKELRKGRKAEARYFRRLRRQEGGSGIPG
jgi:UPF0176 protein